MDDTTVADPFPRTTEAVFWYEQGQKDERQRMRLAHELRMGPFHVVCCFNEVDQRDGER